MKRDKHLKIYFITFILLLNSLMFIIIPSENIKASSLGETKLFFHEYDPFNFSGEIDTYRPCKINDSAWPPKLIKKDTSNLLPTYTLDYDKWLDWMMIWALYKGIDSGFSSSDLNDEALKNLLGTLGITPYKIVEQYQYTGEKTMEVKGDVVFDLFFTSTLASVSSGVITLMHSTLPSVIPENVTDLMKNLEPEDVKVTIKKGEETFENTKTITTSPFKEDIQRLTVKIENVNFNLSAGDTISFSVEIIPGKKIIGAIVDKIVSDENLQKNLEKIVNAITEGNSTAVQIIKKYLPKIYEYLNTTASALKEILQLSEEFEVFKYLPELANTTMISSFIYDSVSHPSSVTLPVSLITEDENNKTYFLHTEHKMDENEPSSTEGETFSFIKQKHTTWDTPDFVRNKILKNATATIYIGYKDLLSLLNLGETKIFSNLLYQNRKIASSEVSLKRNMFFANTLNNPVPIVFNLKIEKNNEISYGDHLVLEIGVANNTKFGPLGQGVLKNIKVFYDAEKYPSFLYLKFEDTDHIKIKDMVSTPENGRIGLQEKVFYTISIFSELDDLISIKINDFSESEKEKWNVSVTPHEFSITPGETKKINVTLVSKSTDIDDYETRDEINVTVVASGKTGINTTRVFAQISPSAVKHDVKITLPDGKKVKHGKDVTYLIVVKNNNSGFYPDLYDFNVSSQHGFNVILKYNISEEIPYGGTVNLTATVYIPEYTNTRSDRLTIEVISTLAHVTWTKNITTKIITPDLLEQIYHFFETSSENIGLKDIAGDYAPHLLASIILIITFFVAIITVAILKRKYVEIICLNRIHEVEPGEESTFGITVKNPSKHTLSYEVTAEPTTPSKGWETSINNDKHIILQPNEQKNLTLTVTPTDYVKPNDWVEIKINVKTIEKNKSESISTVTTIKNAASKLEIEKVTHKPKRFKKGDIVKTSFKIKNVGNAAADNIDIRLFVNGQLKNKIEKTTIPSQGYANVEMPWIAVKGKNNIDIRVIER